MIDFNMYRFNTTIKTIFFVLSLVFTPQLSLSDQSQISQQSIPQESIWSPSGLNILKSLAISSLPSKPISKSNHIADHPDAVALGQSLFFDPILSKQGNMSCAHCHRPALFFTDRLKTSVGTQTLTRNAPSILGLAYQEWLFWDGRVDSGWSQAIVPLEAESEMANDRVNVVKTLLTHPEYSAQYFTLFPELPIPDWQTLPDHAKPNGSEALEAAWWELSDEQAALINRHFTNIGKIIEAFERTLNPTASRFDQYVQAITSDATDTLETRKHQLNSHEIAGLKLFIDSEKTQCLQCHNGPLLSNGGFHNIGTGNFSGDHLDYGRFLGIQALLTNKFNCKGPFSDADPEACDSLNYLKIDDHGDLTGAFKTPSLRNVAETGPYFHDGSQADLMSVIQYYRQPPNLSETPHELIPLDISDQEAQDLVAFLKTLTQIDRPKYNQFNKHFDHKVNLPSDSIPNTLFNEFEKRMIKRLAINQLPSLNTDPNLVDLGEKLFFNKDLSKNKDVSCATCHKPEHYFTSDPQQHTQFNLTKDIPTLIGVGHLDWFFWNGRANDLALQALEPLENKHEMASTRTEIIQYIAQTHNVSNAYEKAFGQLPMWIKQIRSLAASPLGNESEQKAWQVLDASLKSKINQVFINIGYALADYQKTIAVNPNTLDQAVINDNNSLKFLTQAQLKGLKLFLSPKANCISCHNGPLYTDGRFYHINSQQPVSDDGYFAGLSMLQDNQLSCFHQGVNTQPCKIPNFETPMTVQGAFKTPTLRNIAHTAPYFHHGNTDTLEDVLDHYVSRSQQLESKEKNQLTQHDARFIIEFLKIL